MKEKLRFKWKLVVVALLIIMIFPGSLLVQTSVAESIPIVNYKVYYKDYGWSNLSSILESDNECTNRKIESIMIDDGKNNSQVLCSAYIENDGWTPFEKNGKAIGKISRNMSIKRIRLMLEKELRDKYDIEYRVCYKNNLWSKWYSNGEPSGIDASKDIYNLEIRVIEK